MHPAEQPCDTQQLLWCASEVLQFDVERQNSSLERRGLALLGSVNNRTPPLPRTAWLVIGATAEEGKCVFLLPYESLDHVKHCGDNVLIS